MTKSQWTCVEDAMPDVGATVIVSSHYAGDPRRDRFYAVCNYDGSLFFFDDTGDDIYAPTHWMPLPAAPSDIVDTNEKVDGGRARFEAVWAAQGRDLYESFKACAWEFWQAAQKLGGTT